VLVNNGFCAPLVPNQLAGTRIRGRVSAYLCLHAIFRHKQLFNCYGSNSSIRFIGATRDAPAMIWITGTLQIASVHLKDLAETSLNPACPFDCWYQIFQMLRSIPSETLRWTRRKTQYIAFQLTFVTSFYKWDWSGVFGKCTVFEEDVSYMLPRLLRGGNWEL
jgi:hypothetical protein